MREARADEEVGLEADEWSEWKRFFTSPGFAEEEVTIFEATGLSEVEDHEPDPEERIEIVKWPLDDLDGGDRGMPRLEVAHRPPHAARLPVRGRPAPGTVPVRTFAHERVQGEGRSQAR